MPEDDVLNIKEFIDYYLFSYYFYSIERNGYEESFPENSGQILIQSFNENIGGLCLNEM